MESKERVLRVIRHQEVDRIPSYFMSDGNINSKLAARLNIDSSRLGYIDLDHPRLIERLGCDVRLVWPNVIVPQGSKYFSCGSVHAALHEGTVVFEKMPLEDANSVDEILKYKWPSPDWSEYKIPT